MDFNFKPATDSKNALETYGRNLNDEVINNRIDPIIGRDEEIRRLIEILSRKTKNNPVLIGEPGVGKTAIVEGFAQRIVNGDVPENLKDKVVIELSLPSLIAGASYQGQFEERLNAVIKQATDSVGKYILFIDEIHQLVGAGKNSGGAMDAANIFKPMMARGQVKVIGATTLNEYREYIEKDGALERRMQKILVKEPSRQEALTIMRGLKERWELYHKVRIHDSALIAAVDLSDRYIPDRFLPDKAIDLIDEAAARVKVEMHSLPTELDDIKREIIHSETEKASLLHDADPKSQKRLETIEATLTSLKEKQKVATEQWESQRSDQEALNKIKVEIDANKTKMDKFQAAGEYEKASKILYAEIPELEKKINTIEKKMSENPDSAMHDSVTVNEVANVISKATGIPLNKVMATEKTKLLNLSDELMKSVKGQNGAIEVVANAVLRGRAGINDPNKPIGSFLFLGPTGTGKTELAKSLARELFNSEKSMIRIDCSELMEAHSVSKLIGSPAGYIGYGDTNILAEPVRRNPYTVVLFDEIEKANSKVLDLLLQVLDDGQLTDSQGKKINFKNTLIIMTSNLGASLILEDKKDQAVDELQKFFRPEFINRIDEIVVFDKLSDVTILAIIKKMLNDLQHRLSNQEYDIAFDDKIAEHIKNIAYSASYGARAVNRFIQKNIENFLAQEILSNKILKNKPYLISLANGAFTSKTRTKN